jgi:adenylate cyclase
LATPPDSGAVASRRELAAIMFSDIAGYTAIMGRDEQAGLEARNSHRELLRAILPRFNGRLLGDLGDGALSSFHSAIDAVNCARAFQASTGSNPQFRIRIGIHVGDVLFADDTVVGDGVNIASRIQALAPPGGICISERVYEEIRNQRGMAVKSLGQKNLKNVSRPIGVYVLSDGADSSAAAKSPARTSRTKSRVVAMAGAGAIALTALAYVTLTRRSPTPNSTAPLASNSHVIRSIAVLPLDNYSGDPKQEYFADGMTDELTTDLATISQLRVISRGSVMQFKGDHRPPTPVIAKLLNVDAVVEGSVLREGDKVRITAQLIDARADKHLWARSYERDSRDVLALQDELASAIAKEINVQLTPGEQARLSSAPVVNPTAYDAYLKGRYFFNRPSDENLKKAIAQFEAAIRLDPNFAPAYSGLSDAYLWAGFNEGVFTAAEAMPKAKAAAEKAIQLDDTSAEAHTSLAVYELFYEFDWAGCEREFHRAFALNPNYAYAHDQFGFGLALQGRLDQAVAEGKRAIELDPLSPEIAIDVATALAWQSKFEAARQQARKAADLEPTFFFPLDILGWIDIEAGKISNAIPELQKATTMDSPTWVAAWLGYAYGASGDRAHAMAEIAELNKRSLHGYIDPFNLAIVYLGMGDRDRALDSLEKAYAAHSQFLGWLKMDRIFDPLRSEPRFIALLKKLNFEK